MNVVIFSAGKELFRGENNRNLAGNIFKVESGRETNFLGWSSCYLGGEAFQRGRYWGYINVIANVSILHRFICTTSDHFIKLGLHLKIFCSLFLVLVSNFAFKLWLKRAISVRQRNLSKNSKTSKNE